MNIELESINGKSLLSLNEERLDAQNAGELKDYLLQAMENGATALIIDLSKVGFIDSSGLGALVSGLKNANLCHGSLVIAGLQPKVRWMFDLSCLHRVFEIFHNRQEALDHSKSGNPNKSD